MGVIRVLVVDDSLTVRKHLVESLQVDPEVQVVGEAEDGKQAIEMCERLRPDVVTLDMMMPVMTGLAATEYIMAYCPTPIVIVSASLNRGELFRTYDALAAGALDVIEKPTDNFSDPVWQKLLLDGVKMASRVKVIMHPRGRMKHRHRTSHPANVVSADGTGLGRHYDYVAIGASTGGPQALATILSALPADFALPLLIVMHISTAFSVSFAEWLNNQSSIPVTVAARDQPLPPVGTPCAILAPPDVHLTVSGKRLKLTDDAEVHSCRPSVDVLFESVAHEIGNRAIGVLLTGMGRDGARGLLSLRKSGAMTLAQDEASSVVFGMPREAILLGAATRVAPVSEIASHLIELSCHAELGERRI